MKKFLTLLLVASLFLLCLPAVSAAGSVSVNGPSSVRAGDTITVTFSAGGDDIYGGQGTVSYDSNQLSLVSYNTVSPGGSWKVEMSGDKFVFYDDSVSSPLGSSKTLLKATFTVKDLEPGTEISVSVSGIKLSDASFQDSSFGTKTYSATILPPLSDNCTLASMTVGNAEISPAFDPAVTSYSASVPFTTSSLEIEAAAEHPGAKVTIGKTSLTAGGTTTVKVTVKAENGAEKVYSIRVKREQDPNYVASSNAALEMLTSETFPLSPAFSPEVTQYYVWLPYEAQSLNLTATAADEMATVALGNSQALVAGQRTDITVTVTAEDGTVQVYTVTAVRAPALENTEDYLAGRMPAPTEPEVPTESTEATEATEPVTVPTQPQAQQPQTTESDLKTQVIILVGACAACLILGLLIGVLIRSFSVKAPIYQEDEEPADTPVDPIQADMPSFDPSDDSN